MEVKRSWKKTSANTSPLPRTHPQKSLINRCSGGCCLCPHLERDRRTLQQQIRHLAALKGPRLMSKLKRKLAEVQEEIDTLKEELDLSQAELESLMEEISRKERFIDPQDSRFDPSKCEANKAELNLLEEVVAQKKLEHKRLTATTRRMIETKKRQIVILQKGHQVTLAEIDDDQNLDSSDDDGDLGQLADKFQLWEEIIWRRRQGE